MACRLLKIQDWEKLARAAEFQPANMASLCGVSDRQLQRFFRDHFHTTPRHWLRQLQCGLAKQLILRGYSTKAAATEANFATAAHCCREFKRLLGKPPQAFAPSAPFAG